MATAAQVLKYLVTVEDRASAGLKKINTEWKKFTERVHAAERALKPLANKLTAVAGAFVSIQAVRKAISLAKFQIEQQVKLQVALGENIHLFEEQLKAAADFQSATLFTDEVTLSVRAMAFSFGVANEEMNDFIKAASTLAALGLVPSIEAAARQLLFLRSGQGQPLSVISRLPGVKEIPEAEKQAGAVERMINRILGSVAEEVAKTPFGTLQRDINLINDEFERLGRALILVIGPAINRFKTVFSGFVDKAQAFLEPMAPIINAILVPVEGILRRLVTVAALLTVISLSSKVIEFISGGLKFILGPLKALVGLLAAPFLKLILDVGIAFLTLGVNAGIGIARATVQLVSLKGVIETVAIAALMAQDKMKAMAATAVVNLKAATVAVRGYAAAVLLAVRGQAMLLGAQAAAGFRAIATAATAAGAAMVHGLAVASGTAAAVIVTVLQPQIIWVRRQLAAITLALAIQASILQTQMVAALTAVQAQVVALATPVVRLITVTVPTALASIQQQLTAIAMTLATQVVGAVRALVASVSAFVSMQVHSLLLTIRRQLIGITAATMIQANVMAGPLLAAIGNVAQKAILLVTTTLPAALASLHRQLIAISLALAINARVMAGPLLDAIGAALIKMRALAAASAVAVANSGKVLGAAAVGAGAAVGAPLVAGFKKVGGAGKKALAPLAAMMLFFNKSLGKVGKILLTVGRFLIPTITVAFLPVSAVIGIILGLVVAVGAALAIVVAKVRPLREAFQGLLIAIGAFAQAGAQIVVELMQPLFDWTEKILGKFNDWITAQSEANTNFGKWVTWLREVQQGIKDGSKTFEDVADEARLKLLPFIEFWIDLKFFALGTIATIEAGFAAMWEAIKIAGNGVLLALSGTLNGIIRGAAEAIDGILNVVAGAVGIFNKEMAQSIRDIELGQAFEDTELGQLDNVLLDEIKASWAEIETIAANLVDHQEELEKGKKEELAALEDLIEAEEERIPAAIAARARLRAAESERLRRESEERIRTLRELRLASEADLSETMLSMAAQRILTEGDLQVAQQERTNAELLQLAERLQVDRIGLQEDATAGLEEKIHGVLTDREALELAQIEERFEREEISQEDLFEARRRLSTAELRREIKFGERNREIRLKAAEREFANRAQHEQILREFGVEGQELINQLREEEGQIQAEMIDRETGAIADANDMRKIGLGFMADSIEQLASLENERQQERLDFIQEAIRIETNGVRNLTNVIDQATKIQEEITRNRIALQLQLLNLAVKEREAREEEAEAAEKLLQKQREFTRELEGRRLTALGEDFNAAIEEARVNLIEALEEVEELFDRAPSSREMGIFELEQMATIQAAALSEIKQITDEVSDAEQRYADAVQRRTNEVELGITTQQAARVASIEDLQVLEQQTQAQIDFLNSFRGRIEAIPQMAEGMEPVLESMGFAIEDLKNKLLEFKAAAQSMSPDFWAGIGAGIRDFAIEAELNFKKAREFAFDLANTVSTELTDAFISVADHSKSWKEAFSDAAQNILLSIARMIIQMLIMAAIAAALGFPPGTVGALAAGAPRNKGGYISRNEGGGIPGRGPDRDSVLVAATPGEYMLRRRAADYYGSGILNAMNARAIPRSALSAYRTSGVTPSGLNLNQGGRVASGGEREMATAALPATPQTMQTLLAGGGSEMIDFVRDHKDEIFGDDFARTG